MKTANALIVALYAVAVAAYVYFIIRHDRFYKRKARMLDALMDRHDEIETKVYQLEEKIEKPKPVSRKRKK